MTVIRLYQCEQNNTAKKKKKKPENTLHPACQIFSRALDDKNNHTSTSATPRHSTQCTAVQLWLSFLSLALTLSLSLLLFLALSPPSHNCLCEYAEVNNSVTSWFINVFKWSNARKTPFLRNGGWNGWMKKNERERREQTGKAIRETRRKLRTETTRKMSEAFAFSSKRKRIHKWVLVHIGK